LVTEPNVNKAVPFLKETNPTYSVKKYLKENFNLYCHGFIGFEKSDLIVKSNILADLKNSKCVNKQTCRAKI
jgi:hypothetical protein